MSNSVVNIDLDVAMKQFKKRKKENHKNIGFDNSSLPAGSSMYYYCRFCGVPTDTLPESYWGCKPKTICDPCEVLHLNGLI